MTSIPLAHLLTWTAAPEVGDNMSICTLLWLACQEGSCSTQPPWLLSVSSNFRKPREAKTRHSSLDSPTIALSFSILQHHQHNRPALEALYLFQVHICLLTWMHYTYMAFLRKSDKLWLHTLHFIFVNSSLGSDSFLIQLYRNVRGFQAEKQNRACRNACII